HPVPSYEGWKAAFDSDPVGRERSGVRRYQVARSVEDPNYVLIDLEFSGRGEADAFLAAMREVWGRVQGSIIMSPQARIIEVVESREY
ncbi:MAG TPA: hypothetical protein VM409_06865, partial [Chloroflexia bacterium]|nr:hypothetical protein [Chloroflexia bacterium]